ncbi:MAG: alpha/beta hydrolase [Steroidobacteraceae bacterium]
MTVGTVALERLSIDGPAGRLQAIVEDPKLPAECYAVLCHPHPLHGGTMDNKVVVTLARALRETGIPTLRFNFRGVGSSAGTYDEGNGETADADAVASYGALRWPGRRLLLAGFSFGAYVALRLALERDACRLITVAPAVDRMGFSALATPNCPWLVVQGDSDEVVDPKRVYAWVESCNPQPKLVVMPGVGHFFHGHLPLLRQAVIDAIRSG